MTQEILPAPPEDEERQDVAIQGPGDIQVVANTSSNAFDIDPVQFQAALDKRKENRQALFKWLKDALVDGVDVYRLKMGGKETKPSLGKSGSEKILGMLGLTAVFPDISAYADKAIRGEDIEQIILRCHLLDGSGQIVGEGVGARHVKQDRGDLNKALKMAEKSAQIDAVLRTAGLSEVYTQDIEDMQKDKPKWGGQDTKKLNEYVGLFMDRVEQGEPKSEVWNDLASEIEDQDFEAAFWGELPSHMRSGINRERKGPAKTVPFGKHKGTPWTEVSSGYLEWVLKNIDNKPDVTEAARLEKERRDTNQDTGDFVEEFDQARGND